MRNKVLIIFSLMSILSVFYAQEAPDQFPQEGAREENYLMKVTARVIDEDGNPLANTPIRIGIHNVNDYKDGYNDFRGHTDAKGKFTAKGIGRGLAKINVEQEGFYPSQKTVTCYEGTPQEVRNAGRFFPWNPTIDVVLKKVGKPIPMLVRRASGGSKSWFKLAPEQADKELGWDLVVGDWVIPEGQGVHRDIIIKYKSNYKNPLNYSSSMTLSLGNPDDGLVAIPTLTGEESLLKFPRIAPVSGYNTRKLEFLLANKDGVSTEKPLQREEGYFIRLRTKKDSGGRVLSAMYGKITRPFDFQTGKGSALVQFDYYLNLTLNDRNLEYDQKNNLAPEADKDLRWPP